MPKRDEWVRIGYTCIGGGVAILWDRYMPLNAKGGGYIPPAALATLILLSEDAGATEKDIAAGILGYSSVAQAVSFVTNSDVSKASGISSIGDSHELSVEPQENPYDKDAEKLQKIRAVTGTLGALADIVGKFKGIS